MPSKISWRISMNGGGCPLPFASHSCAFCSQRLKEVGGVKKFRDLLDAVSVLETDQIPF